MRDASLESILIEHERNFFIIFGIILFFMVAIISADYFHDQSNDYKDQILEICENYDVEDENVGKKNVKSKNSSTKQNMRSYHMASINLFINEVVLKDGYYYGEGEPMSLLIDSFEKLQTLEKQIKSGVYGSNSNPVFDVFKNKPGCYRSQYLLHQCDEKKYNE
ncbi:hypothetical protein PIROE2DRAFT_17770, partial [Piromyces sp. E2]